MRAASAHLVFEGLQRGAFVFELAVQGARRQVEQGGQVVGVVGLLRLGRAGPGARAAPAGGRAGSAARSAAARAAACVAGRLRRGAAAGPGSGRRTSDAAALVERCWGRRTAPRTTPTCAGASNGNWAPCSGMRESTSQQANPRHVAQHRHQAELAQLRPGRVGSVDAQGGAWPRRPEQLSAMSSVSRPWWRHQRLSATPSVGALSEARASMP